MQQRPRRRSANRREELIDAAVRRFAAGGLQGTSVDDIVREAGAAKGTFYLYFTSRDEIVTAVAERLVERIGADMERALADEAATPARRIGGIAAAMSIVTADSYESELIAEIHKPANAVINDRLSAQIMARLRPAVVRVIVDGIVDGSFVEQDPERAAAFVLAAHAALDGLVRTPADLAPASRDLNAFVLRGLGYTGDAA